MSTLQQILLIALMVLVTAMLVSASPWCRKVDNRFGRQMCAVSVGVSGFIAALAAIVMTFGVALGRRV